MKTFNSKQEVKDRIDALFSELHDLCSENQIPYVASCITSNIGEVAEQVVSVWLDSDQDLAPMNLTASMAILDMPFVPEELFDFVMEVSSDLDDGTECDCPECQLASNAASNLH